MPKLESVLKHPLFAGSAVMIFGSFFTSFINYLFHLVLGRMLGPASYGELASVVSLVGLIGIFSTSFGLVITRLISQTNDHDQVKNIVVYFNLKVLFFGFVIFILVSLLSPLISSFLNLRDIALIILGSFSIIFSVSSTFSRSVLQGLLRFRDSVISQLTENSIKLISAVVLVYLSFSVKGSIIGLSLGPLFGWLVALLFLKDFPLTEKAKEINVKPIINYTLPVLLLTVASTSLYSSDLILVKHFFDSYQAGLYAALSFSGRIIFFATSPITSVMFPLVSKRFAQGEGYKQIFKLSLVGAALVSTIMIIIFKFFPDIAIKILYGSSYLSASHLLVFFALFMSLNALSFMLANYFLAIGRPKIVSIYFIAAIFQILGIWFFHHSLYSVALVSIIDCALLLIGLLISL